MRQNGRQVAPVILVDPPPLPKGYERRASQIDPRNPKIAARLYEHARSSLLDHLSRAHNDAPFDLLDPKQIHLAALAGVGMYVAFARYMPSLFPGRVEVIMAADGVPGFFHPQMPWHNLLPGPCVVHVLPWVHGEMFRAGLESICRLLKFMLDAAPMLETRTGLHRHLVGDARGPTGSGSPMQPPVS